jgi:hypothetical protein
LGVGGGEREVVGGIVSVAAVVVEVVVDIIIFCGLRWFALTVVVFWLRWKRW